MVGSSPVSRRKPGIRYRTCVQHLAPSSAGQRRPARKESTLTAPAAKPTPDEEPAASSPAASEALSHPGSRAGAPSVTLRILLLSTVLIFVNCYWVIQVEGIWHTNHATAMSLFWNTVFCLLLLVLFNIFVMKRFFPRRAFSQGELITCYVMMTLAS